MATRQGKANPTRRKIPWNYCILNKITSLHPEIGTVNLLILQSWWTYFSCGERLLQSQAMEMVIRSCDKKWKELCPWRRRQHVPPTRLNSKKSWQSCYHWEMRKSYSVSCLYLTKKIKIKIKKKLRVPTNTTIYTLLTWAEYATTIYYFTFNYLFPPQALINVWKFIYTFINKLSTVHILYISCYFEVQCIYHWN